MTVAPGLQAGLNAVLVRIHKGPWDDGVFYEGLEGLLLHLGHQIDHHLTTALHHPKNWRSLFLQRPTATFAFQAASTTFAALALEHLWLSFVVGNPIRFLTFDLV